MNADKLLTQREVAAMLQMSVENVGKLRSGGHIQYFILGHRTVRIAESEVWRFLEKRQA